MTLWWLHLITANPFIKRVTKQISFQNFVWAFVSFSDEAEGHVSSLMSFLLMLFLFIFVLNAGWAAYVHINVSLGAQTGSLHCYKCENVNGCAFLLSGTPDVRGKRHRAEPCMAEWFIIPTKKWWCETRALYQRHWSGGELFNHGLRGVKGFYHNWSLSRANCGYMSLSESTPRSRCARDMMEKS